MTRYRLSSPPPLRAGGAIGIIHLHGDIDATLAAMGVRPVSIGSVSLREIPGVDTIIVARLSNDAAMLFPHAGPAVMARVIGALESVGVVRADAGDLSPREKFPEAASEVEARMLDALARARSPLAIDLLLDQPRRWSPLDPSELDPSRVLSDDDSRRLRRLIDPPLVVALGAPNIGKSSLVNALAGRSVAIVADVPGTTRDHVGVMLDLAGLVVRYVDTPGIGPTAQTGDHAAPPDLDRLAQQTALRVARDADLVLLCADAGSTFVNPHGSGEVLTVGLRADLGHPHQPCDVAVSARTGQGLESLTTAVRNRLVPPALLVDRRAWRFWPTPERPIST